MPAARCTSRSRPTRPTSINATQFLLKLRAARLDAARAAARAAAVRSASRSAVIPIRAAGCDDEPVLRERGQREVFCGLTGIIWLHRKIQDAFFLVVGSRTCAHLIQSAAGVMIFAEPRFATAIIDDRDLAGLADANEELDRVVTRLLARRPEIKLLFLVGSCPSEVIKLDLSRAAQRLSKTLRTAGAGAQLFRQRHRDHLHSGRGRVPCLARAEMPPQAPGAAGRCWSSARSPMSSRTSSRASSTRWGSARVRFFPPRHAADLAPIGPNTRFLLAQPFLADTARALEERGAIRTGRAVPARRRRHHGLAASGSAGVRRDAGALRRRRRATARAGKARPRRATATSSPASASSSSPTRSSRSRSRASSPASCGMQLVEVGTPYLHRQHLAEELALLPAGTFLSRRAGRREAARPLPRRAPDLTVCGLGLANPLEAEGLTTKWSIELVFTPIHGYDQAADLAELFTRPLQRRLTLCMSAVATDMQLTLWTYEGPPHVGAMRIATAMKDVHYVLHAPQGDTYADLLFTMIERLPRRPPVTYTTFQARDLGSDTAELFKNAARDAFERFRPKAMLVGASCTAELIQDDPGGLAKALDLPIPVIALELPSYQRRRTGARPRPSIRCAERWPVRMRRRRARPRPRATRHVARAATSSARARSAFGIATTCARSPRCSGSSASTSTSSRRSAPARTTSHASAKPISTSSSIPKSRSTAAQWLTRTFAHAGDEDDPDRRRRDARVHRRSRRARRHRRRAGARRDGFALDLVLRVRSTRPTCTASASSSSATRRTPSPPRASPPRNSASRSAASAPTAASSRATCAMPRRSTASRR